jgi:NADH:ubiquinone oxidoreductase subunit 4 (subunit M)
LGALIYIIVSFTEKEYAIKQLRALLVFIGIYYFYSRRIIIFFLILEISIIPIIFIILGFGRQVEKIEASFYLLFYMIIAGFPFIFVYFSFRYLPYLVYFDQYLSQEFELILILGFLMKFPVYFLHYWLPKVHVESPTTGRMLLAGYLLKFGTHGFRRFAGSLMYVSLFFLFVICYLGIVVSCVVSLFQRDVKSIIAYSSIVHMRFLVITIMLYSGFRKNSRLAMILGHGFVSVLMFYVIGEIIHFLRVRVIYYYNGLISSNFFFRFVVSIIFFVEQRFTYKFDFFFGGIWNDRNI